MLRMTLTLNKRIGLFPSGMNFGLFVSPFSKGAVYEKASDYAALDVILGILTSTSCCG